MPSIDRRTFLMSVSVAALAPSLMDNEAARALGNQAGSPPMRVRGLNHMTLAVSDPKRSIEFYQGLFGMPIQARQGPTVLLSIGSGPQASTSIPGGISSVTSVGSTTVCACGMSSAACACQSVRKPRTTGGCASVIS